jgi:hypothetical protein
MAELIHAYDSYAKCKNATSRLIRLGNQIPGASAFTSPLSAPLKALAQKQLIVENLGEEVDFAKDMVILQESVVDNEVRNLFDSCMQHQRSNPGSKVLSGIFPSGKFGDFISLETGKKPAEAQNLAERVKTFSTGNGIAEYAEKLAIGSKNLSNTITAVSVADTNLSGAVSALDIERENLCRDYENVYLDIRRSLGKDIAEQVFPKLKSKPKDKAKKPAAGADTTPAK